jgi:hypothetical protein
MTFVIELSFLDGRAKLPRGVPVHGVVVF